MSDIAYFFGRSLEEDKQTEMQDHLLDVYLMELHRVNPDLRTKYTLQHANEDLKVFSLVPFLTTLGTLKGLEKDYEERRGPFDLSNNQAEVDKLKMFWLDRSFQRSIHFMKHHNTLDRLKVEKKDPWLPVIPGCFCWCHCFNPAKKGKKSYM